jgi:hypothetical protein
MYSVYRNPTKAKRRFTSALDAIAYAQATSSEYGETAAVIDIAVAGEKIEPNRVPGSFQ